MEEERRDRRRASEVMKMDGRMWPESEGINGPKSAHGRVGVMDMSRETVHGKKQCFGSSVAVTLSPPMNAKLRHTCMRRRQASKQVPSFDGYLSAQSVAMRLGGQLTAALRL